MNLKEAKEKRQAQMQDLRSAEQVNKDIPDNIEAVSAGEPEESQNRKGENEMEEKVRDGIEKIRPFLQRDGGDIEFVEYTDDHIVKVRLQGHCAGCPGAQMTIKGVVERILKESYPEVAGVEAVQ